MTSLPLNEQDILVYVREILNGIVRSSYVRKLRETSEGAGRDFVTGEMIRYEYAARAELVLHTSEGLLGATVSWTAALSRLSRDGKLERVPLYGPRGARRGWGFTVAK